MAVEPTRDPLAPKGAAEFDELQRGEEAPLTVENIERMTPPHYGQRQDVPVPDPGERPGAVRVDTPLPQQGQQTVDTGVEPGTGPSG